VGASAVKTMRAGVWAAAAWLLVAGCSVTRELTTLEQLREATPATLRVMATDRTIYELTTYTVRDSMLEGSGTHLVNGARSPFAGQLPYRDLVYIQVRQGDFWRTAAAVAAMGFTASCFSAATQDHGLSIYPKGSSCPYVYVWDGAGYGLQGEAFGTSFGKALEAGTICMLPAAAARNDALLVRITNERPETHYVNRVRLLAFEAPEGAAVLVDNENRAWPVTDPRPPIRSSPELSRKDGACWTSDLSKARRGEDYRDHLDLTFPHPPQAATASVIVHAINTELVYSAYDLVFGYLGDQSLPFLYQVENDPQLIGTLQSWIRECSLAVEVWKGGQWESAGAIAPEANVAPFSRIVRIDATGVAEDSVRVRLSSLADGWRIDAVEIDWTQAAPLEARALAMRSAVHSDGTSMMASLSEADAGYATVFPGERIDMSFDARDAGGNGSVAYALDVSGYLHEWPPESVAASPVSLFPASFGSDRVAVVNYLVRHREAFLPLVYDHWKHRRERATL
jgi:hypothetical protein